MSSRQVKKTTVNLTFVSKMSQVYSTYEYDKEHFESYKSLYIVGGNEDKVARKPSELINDAAKRVHNAIGKFELGKREIDTVILEKDDITTSYPIKFKGDVELPDGFTDAAKTFSSAMVDFLMASVMSGSTINEKRYWFKIGEFGGTTWFWSNPSLAEVGNHAAVAAAYSRIIGEVLIDGTSEEPLNVYQRILFRQGHEIPKEQLRYLQPKGALALDDPADDADSRKKHKSTVMKINHDIDLIIEAMVRGREAEPPKKAVVDTNQFQFFMTEGAMKKKQEDRKKLIDEKVAEITNKMKKDFKDIETKMSRNVARLEVMRKKPADQQDSSKIIAMEQAINNQKLKISIRDTDDWMSYLYKYSEIDEEEMNKLMDILGLDDETLDQHFGEKLSEVADQIKKDKPIHEDEEAEI